MMEKLLLNANKIWKTEAAIACAFLFANVMLIMANIIMRRFFNAPIFGSTELIRYISLVAASLSIAQNEWIGGNISMTLIPEKLKAKAATRLGSITSTVVAGFFILVTYLLYIQVHDKFVKLDVSYELQLPVWIFALVLAVGFTALTATTIIKTILLWYVELTGAPKINFRGLVVQDERKILAASRGDKKLADNSEGGGAEK